MAAIREPSIIDAIASRGRNKATIGSVRSTWEMTAMSDVKKRVSGS